MSASGRAPGVSQLDEAHGLRLRGEREAALRVAASRLRAAREDLDAAALVARLLLDANRAQVAGELGARLVDARLRRGDLPGAWLAAQLALEAGGFADDALRRIAAACGKGSPRLARSAAASPPPLLSDVPIDSRYASVAGDALLDEVEKLAARFLGSEDPQPEGAPIPELPLWSALDPAKLLKLLGRLQLRELDAGSVVVAQGTPGTEAFVIARGAVNVLRLEPPASPVVLATLASGAIFGEMALVSQAPRAAQVIAREPVQLMVMARQALEELAAEDAAIGRELGAFCYGRMLSNLIRHSPILSSVAEEQRPALIARFATRTFQRGEHLVRAGEESGQLYLLASGAVQVSREADGERTVLAQLGPGQSVGEISLVLRKPATADVVALNATVALALSREQFHEAIREYPALLRELYDTAVQREEETRNIMAQRADDVSDVVLL
jgi:cAMP-dependent protein kinase regulator